VTLMCRKACDNFVQGRDVIVLILLQSSSLFSDTKMVNDMDSKSRLFGAYERQGNTTTPSNATDVGPYTTES